MDIAFTYQNLGRLMWQHATGAYGDTAFHMFLQESYCPIMSYERRDSRCGDVMLPLCPSDPMWN